MIKAPRVSRCAIVAASIAVDANRSAKIDVQRSRYESRPMNFESRKYDPGNKIASTGAQSRSRTAWTTSSNRFDLAGFETNFFAL
jgi:hypothetical protein